MWIIFDRLMSFRTHVSGKAHFVNLKSVGLFSMYSPLCFVAPYHIEGVANINMKCSVGKTFRLKFTGGFARTTESVSVFESRNQCGNNMESMWNQYKINVEPIWNQCGINMESMRNWYEINMETMWNQSVSNMELMWNQYEINVEPICSNMQQKWNQCGTNMESMRNQYEINMEPIWYQCGTNMDSMCNQY